MDTNAYCKMHCNILFVCSFLLLFSFRKTRRSKKRGKVLTIKFVKEFIASCPSRRGSFSSFCWNKKVFSDLMLLYIEGRAKSFKGIWQASLKKVNSPLHLDQLLCFIFIAFYEFKDFLGIKS